MCFPTVRAPLVFGWLALVAAGCGPGPLPHFPPHAPAPNLTLSLPAIERRFREEGTENVTVEVGAPYERPRLGPVESVAVTLSPAPPKLVEAAFGAPGASFQGYVNTFRDVLGLRPFDGKWELDAQRRVVFEEKHPPLETGCRVITVTVDIHLGESSSVAHIVRSCVGRRRAPPYASRRLPAMPPAAKGVVLECVRVGGGAAFVYEGLSIDDYGDVYQTGYVDLAPGDYVRTIPPDEMEEAMGLAALATHEPKVPREPEVAPDHGYTASVGGGCNVTLEGRMGAFFGEEPGGRTVSLGSPDKPDRDGPASRTLLRWLDKRGIYLRE